MNAPHIPGPAFGGNMIRYRKPHPETAGVLVTGAGRRIGRSIARSLAAEGWRVVIHYHGSERAALALRDEIRAAGGTVEVLQADLSCAKQTKALILQANDLIGPIGVLINNASVFEWDDIESVDGGSWARHMEINLRAPLLLCQAFAERLHRDAGGVIINMLDSRVLNPGARHLTYTLSKTGLWTLTRVLARALAPQIRINGIGPGPTLPWRGQSAESFEARCARLPLQSPASLAEVCEATKFLIGAASMTGQIIALDGGDHLVDRHPVEGLFGAGLSWSDSHAPEDTAISALAAGHAMI